MPEICGHWILEREPLLGRVLSLGRPVKAQCAGRPAVPGSRGPTATARRSGGHPEHRRSLGSWSCLLTCVLLAGAEAKTILPKKEKLKLRRERWLQSKLPRPISSCSVPGGLLSWAASEPSLWVVRALEEAACAMTGRWPRGGAVALSPVRGSAWPYLTPHQECHRLLWVKRRRVSA